MSLVEQEYQAVLAVLSDGHSVSEVAEQWGVSRQSVHAWLRRYEDAGLEGLRPRTRRPATCHQMSGAVEAQVLNRCTCGRFRPGTHLPLLAPGGFTRLPPTVKFDPADGCSAKRSWSQCASSWDMSSTLYDEIGGRDGLQRLSNAFYDRVLADELLAPVFAHFTPTHVDHVAVWLAEVFGGPAEFTASLGGHPALLRSHLGLGIRDDHRQRWLDLMAEAIEDVLPGRAALGRSLMDYFEWGTAIAQSVSQDPVGTDLGDPGPTPRWGWHGLE